MIRWLVSKNGVVTISFITLLVVLDRMFVDFQFVYSEFAPTAAQIWPADILTTMIFGAWIWALISASHGSLRGLVGMLVLSVLTVILGISTVTSLCPTPCGTAWPLMETANWANLVMGVISTIATAWHVFRNHM